jgi:type II secretion system protein I|tara:strand:- start:2904 stop:3284 length:381 start_codon:yes stop_codon:yes gene_type:complete
MENLPSKSNLSRGFSLLEVAVALLILSTSIVAIYQFISSTQLSSYQLHDRVIAREVANNRVALMQTIDPPPEPGKRSGQVTMNGRDWLWEESTTSTTRDLFEFSITVMNKESNQTIFIREGYIAKQ